MNDLYVCVKHINNFRYAIHFLSLYKREEVDMLVDTLMENTKLVDVKINSAKSIVYFSAKKVVSFIDFLGEFRMKGQGQGGSGNLSYDKSFSLFEQMYNLVNGLQERGYSLSVLDIKNMIVIDDSVFLYLGIEHIVPLNEREEFACIQPFYKNIYELCSPELLNIKKLPCFISSKSIYYSIGLLIFYCLFGHDDWDARGDEECSARGDEECSAGGDEECSARGVNQEQIESELQKIESTKLYWILLSCLKMDPEERNIILV